MAKKESVSTSKLAIIYGSDSTNDGVIEYIGNIEEDKRHIFPIVDYLHTHYLDDELLQKVTPTTYPDIVLYFLLLKGNIIFVNSSNSTHKPGTVYEKKGFFMMPNIISPKQKLSLINLKKDIADFSYIQINKDITFTDGLLNSTVLISDKAEPTSTIIDKYIITVDKELEASKN